METSILRSVKKILGLEPSYTVFDQDVMMFINGAFSTLTDLGVGPANGFAIDSATNVWSEFLGDITQLSSVKTYIHLRVKMVFDPPTTPYVIAAFEKQISELEWRLNVRREATSWVNPVPVVVLPNE